MKTVVTHIGPDLDAITSVWLVKTRIPGWEDAALAFVPAGTTLKGLPPDADPDVIHVDTGFGRFDHHQTDADTCASLLVYEFTVAEKGTDPALERLLAVVNDIDHFREVYYPNPEADYWNLSVVSAIDGWRLLYSDNPIRIVHLGMDALDGIYKTLQNKVWADKEIREKGIVFDTAWGKAMGIETVNDEVVHLGQKQGYKVVVRKDPKKGYIRIKALPIETIDLTPAYELLKELDPDATWFLHASRHMILNGSTHNPEMKPTRLKLGKIMEIVKSVRTGKD
ncbi:hypothetical protein A2Z33_01515 [Candidatus Gottesmanbacteria bacterium RBG_16_52_11]|uniref:Uncharacterized protein n=1 Tax=Candidatus Gottesmanbacteria bacterium RBG_16_52_11 TaxID=1798374 RepID=A0A1F5YNX5_9BACT|nr:MAG: hypothetical protein A2Z33_01515 [Candidatus Gottesmanbacteria bacterium RBG_16_52_11]